MKKNIYPGYAESQKAELPDTVVIEHTLKYTDIEQIKLLINKYGMDECKKVWIKTLIPDERLKKLNYFLAKFIFKISSDDAEIKKHFDRNKKTRLDRINEILNG